MPTLQEIADEVKSLAHEMSARVETADKEQKTRGEELTSKIGTMAAEYKSSFDAMNARINSLMDELQKAQTEARVSAQRPPLANEKKERGPGHQAFMFLMKACGDINAARVIADQSGKRETFDEGLTWCVKEYMPQERKALYAADATTGGFFASTDFVDELIQYRLLISPMRSICRQMTTSGERVQMPALANDTTAYWATEQSSYTDSQDPTVGMINIPVHELRGLLKISQQNLEDSMFNLEDLIKQRLTQKFAQKEGAGFVSGDGHGKPQGLLSYNIKASASYTGGSAGKNTVTDAIPYVPSGVANNINADSILNVFMDLKSYYAPNATWIFTRSTLNSIRLLKDSMNRPLWQPFAAANLPSTIYDRPYVEMPDMPEIAANAYAVAVGDFQNYLIVDRISLAMQQLNELYAQAGLVGFIARVRVGGGVLLPESFRLLKISVS